MQELLIGHCWLGGFGAWLDVHNANKTAKPGGFCAVILEIYDVPASPECLSCFILGLGMENIGGIFVVLICGLIVAIFMAMLEFLWSLRHSEQSEVGLGVP